MRIGSSSFQWTLRTLRRGLPWLIVLLALPAPALARIELDAAPEIVQLIAPHLPEETMSTRRLRNLVEEILATEGYFNAQLNFTRPADDERGGPPLRLTIETGPRTRISHVAIRIDGPLAAVRREKLLADWRLPVGQPFRQATWNDAKQALLAQLLAEDHPAGRLLDSQAQIDADTQTATLTLHYDSGPRYLYAQSPLVISGLTRYPPSLIAHYSRNIQPGARYRAADLDQLQAALQASPYFSRAEVRLQRDHTPADDAGDAASADASVDTVRAAVADAATGSAPEPDSLPAIVSVSLHEKPAHRISLGAGASSNTGLRGEFAYATPNFANQAWDLQSGLRLEQKRQLLYADIFLLPDAHNRRLSLGVLHEISDIQGLRTVRQAIGAQAQQRRGSIEQLFSLNWQQERRAPEGAAARTNHALIPNLMWTWRRLDSLIEPRAGTVIQAQAGGALRGLLSDTNFLRLAARIQHYLPIGQRDQLLLRGELGHTRAGASQRIPQDYLFRTGGAGTLRGYAYQSLGIKEGSATVGGRYLGLLSVEYTHWLADEWRDWGIAGFVDAGNVSNSWSDFRYAVGYGLGARWRSPAGPIGADLAYGQRNHSLQLHFSLAIPF